MSKFLDLQLKFLSYDSSAESNDPADAIKLATKVQESAVTEVFRIQTSIPTATVDQAVTLPDAATDYLIILSDREISVKLNGNSDVQVLKPKTPGKKCLVLMIRGTVSGLSISNASGTAANLDLIMVNI